jgi:hypothetical protein
MLPTKTEINQQGDLGGEKVAMRLDETATAHIMSLLTDLYQDPEGAIVREYITNAIDAHIQAGQKRPVEVTTPTILSYYFTVKDYGVGLSRQDIVDVYSKYGASTARGTNDKTGMLGLGCKSALTYTNQFNIRAVKDGIEIYVSVSRSSDGSGQMEIVYESTTDKGNSVEIIIPAARYNQLESKTKEFLFYCTPGTVLLNGAFPKYFEGKNITDEIYLVPNRGKSKIVMGNVAYPMPELNETQHLRSYDYHVVCFVPMGSVNFTPSREQLHLTDLTKATLKRLNEEFKTKINDAISKEIENSETHSGAIEAYLEWRKIRLPIDFSKVTYRGAALETEWEFNGSYLINAYGRNQFDRIIKVNYENLKRSCVIVGFDKDGLSSHDRGKIRRYQELNETGYNFYFCNKMPGSPWTDDIKTVSWDDVKAVKFEKREKTKTYYQVWMGDGSTRTVPVDEIDTKEQLYYMSDAENKEVAFNVRKIIPGKSMIVCINRNRWKLFLERYPNALHFRAGVEKCLSDFIDSLTSDEKLALSLDHHARSICAKLDPKDILDPVLRNMVKMAKEDAVNQDLSLRFESMRELARQLGKPFPKLDKINLDAYPLISNVNSYYLNAKHATLYVNAVYNQGAINEI